MLLHLCFNEPKAKNAEKISKKQMALAYAFNDPNAICRCKLFLAFAFIQLTKFREANLILRFHFSLCVIFNFIVDVIKRKHFKIKGMNTNF